MDKLIKIKECTGALAAHGEATFIMIPWILIMLIFLKMILDVFGKENSAKITSEKVAKTIIGILIGVFAIIMANDAISFSLWSDNVEVIKSSAPEYFKDDGITYEDALKYYADNVKWDAFTAKNDIEIVNADGKFKYSDKHTDFSLQFEFTKDMSSFKPRAMTIDDKDVSPEAVDYFIFSMFVSCRDDSPMYFDVDDIPDLDTIAPDPDPVYEDHGSDSEVSYEDDSSYPVEDTSSASLESKEEKPEEETKEDDEDNDYKDKIIGQWNCTNDGLVYVFNTDGTVDFYEMYFIGPGGLQYYGSAKYSITQTSLHIDRKQGFEYKYSFIDDDTIHLKDLALEEEYDLVKTYVIDIPVRVYSDTIQGWWVNEDYDNRLYTFFNNQFAIYQYDDDDSDSDLQIYGEFHFIGDTLYITIENEDLDEELFSKFKVSFDDWSTMCLDVLDDNDKVINHITFYRTI